MTASVRVDGIAGNDTGITLPVAMNALYDRLTRHVLLGPGIVRRAAARRARTREERWMLTQPRDVRYSYVREVLDKAGEPRAQEIWMLRQPELVRESYVREVLEGAG